MKYLLLLLVIMCPLAAHARDISAQSDVTDRSIFVSGDYYWHDQSSSGPLTVDVDIHTQMAYVKRGGVLVGVTSVSSGRDGFETPQGRFTILGKEVNHWSKKYQANMPWTMWITNDGVALHSGGIPGHPSSHGCVHLPDAFARLLYGAITPGTIVTVSDTVIRQDLDLSL